jgi:chromosome segregation ATPase
MRGAATKLSIIITAVDDASAQLTGVFNGVETKASEAQQSISELGTQMTVAGVAMAGIGAGITDFLSKLVDAGTQGVTASESLNQTLASLISTAQQDTASKDANAAAVQKLNAQHATLTAQLELEQQAMQKDIDKYGQNSPQVADAAAKIQTYEASLQKVNDALDQHQALLNLASASIAGLSQQFTEASDANVKLGFNVEDSLRSFQSLMQATHDVTQSMDLNTLAMNLARDKQEDLGTATNQVVQILEGGGRAAKQFGINMSETATPAQALAQLTQMLGGQAQAYADGPAGKAAMAQAEWNKTMEDAGTTILPLVDALIGKIGNLSREPRSSRSSPLRPTPRASHPMACARRSSRMRASLISM